MSATTLTPQELVGFVQSIYGAELGGASEILGQINYLKEVASNSALTEAQKYQAIAEQYYGQYGTYAERAAEFAQRAENASNQSAAAVYRKFADTFTDVAAQRQTLGDAEWAKKISQESSLALREIGGVLDAAGRIGATLGPVVDGLQMGPVGMRGLPMAIGMRWEKPVPRC